MEKLPKNVEKAARGLVMDVIARKNPPKPADEKALADEGYKSVRVRMAGMDGLKVYRAHENHVENMLFIAAPRKYDPAKRQRAKMYPYAEVRALGKVDDAVCAHDRNAAEKAEREITMPSLKRMADEAIEYMLYEMRMEEKAKAEAKVDVSVQVHDAGDGVTALVMEPKKDEPEPEPAHEEIELVEAAPVETEKSLIQVLYELFTEDPSLGYEDKREKGGAFWVTGNTKPYRETLKKAGMKYSAKRRAWWTKEVA